MSKNSLASLQSRLSAALQDRTEILEGYRSGSQATGRAQAHSDIDVAFRVIDESGEDYLYPESRFVLVDIPLKAREALTAAS